MTASFPQTLAKLAAGQRLSREESHDAILHVTSGHAAEQEILDLLTHLTWLDATVDELTGAASAMRQMSLKIDTGSAEVLDTCGTGGDQRHTFNISTAAAIIAASCGVKIVKHGNRSASGRSGSADVLEKLGVNLEPLPEILKKCLESANLCFAFARAHHPAMRHVGEARKRIGKPTIFNVLGPLTNPGEAKLHLVGVFHSSLTEKLAHVLKSLGARRAWIVHSEDGMDEISTLAPTNVSELHDGKVTTWKLDAAQFGLPKATIDDLQVSGVDEAASVLTDILSGQPGPRRQIAELNAAAAVTIAGKANDLRDALSQAAQAIDSGAARRTLADLVRFSQSN